LSPWPYFIAALALCWTLLITHHLVSHTSAHLAATSTIFAMWALMTVAMMAPTAVPVLASLRDVLGATSLRPWWAFLGGYLTVWLTFASAAAIAQRWLGEHQLIGHNGASTSYVFTGVLLGLAGAYQFTSLKRRCVTECVTPMTFFLRYWRDGVGGGLRMGVRHGVSCLGCCWALMLLAFVGGITNIWFMVLCAVIMSLEKLPAVGRFITAPLGVVLIAASAVFVLVAATHSDPLPSHHHMTIGRKESNEQMVSRG
jgi:predicted metal-binding membrane protein